MTKIYTKHYCCTIAVEFYGELLVRFFNAHVYFVLSLKYIVYIVLSTSHQQLRKAPSELYNYINRVSCI